MSRFKTGVFLFVMSILMFPKVSFCQMEERVEKDSLETDYTILPVLFYLPETSLAGGATGIISLKNSSQGEEERPSQILFAAIYTLKNQIEILGNSEFYRDQRKHRYKVEVGFYRYSYNYFGIGYDSKASDFEKFAVNFPRLELSYARKLYKIFNIGVGYKMDYFDMREIKAGGLLDTNRPIGWDGGFKSNIAGLFFIDTRDNINAPYRGFYGELVYQRSLGWFFSDFDYTKIEADIRYFTPLADEWTIGHQLWITHTTSGTPFYDLGHISTSSRSRGFDDRRFISEKMVTLQSELRFPIAGRFRGSTFYTYNLMPDSWSTPFENTEYFTYGIGLRFVLKEESRAGLRFDLARGDGKYNFFATFNEAF